MPQEELSLEISSDLSTDIIPYDPPIKRVLEIMGSIVGLALFSPLLVAISITVKLGDSGPVLYKATRAGKNGHPFTLYKFRTMIVGADRLGTGITANADDRITGIGRKLRNTKLDELPQLINILRGEMSLVGPRPEDPRYVALCTPEQRLTLTVRPGMTSAASLAYRREEEMLTGEDCENIYRQRIIPQKLSIDLNYLARRTFLSDLVIILRSVRAIF